MMSAMQQKPLGNQPTGTRFCSADEVAEAIFGGQYLRHASKRPRADGRGQETQCVVAANAPQLCDRWDDWGKMPTASAPSKDGWPPRAHYGFCPECAQVCKEAELKLGPPLRGMIVGKPAEGSRKARPQGSNHHDGTDAVTAVAQHLRRVELAASTRRASCNMAPGVSGDPGDGLDQIPVFRTEDFPDHYACNIALTDTSDPWWLRIRNHADPEMTDTEFRRNTAAKQEAVSKAKQCLLHGPVVCKLEAFRQAVSQHYEAHWPKEWAERVAFAKSRQGGGNGKGRK